MAGNDPLGLLGEAASGDPLGLLDAPVKEKVTETVTETPAESSIPTATIDANEGIVPASAGEFDIKNPTRANGVINLPKGGVTSVALQIEQDKYNHSPEVVAENKKAETIANDKKSIIEDAKVKIRNLGLNSIYNNNAVDPMVGQQQQSIDGYAPGNAVEAAPTDFETGLNQILNPPQLSSMATLDDKDREELMAYAQQINSVAPAIQKYSKELEQKPDDVNTLNNLAGNLAAIDDPQALSLFAKANSIEENSTSLMGLGDVFLKSGKDEDAKKAFADAYKKDGNPDALLKAAYTDSKIGNYKESEKVLETIKSKYPDYSYTYALSAYNKEASGDTNGAAADNAAYELLRQQELLPESVNHDDSNSDYAKERNKQAQYMRDIAAAMEAPINFFGEMEMGTIQGGIEGLKKFGEGMEGILMRQDKIGATLNILNGAAETVFSGAMAMAPMTNAGFHALPEPVTRVLMQPLSVVAGLSDEQLKDLGGNTSAMFALGNTLASIALLGAVHKGPKQFTEKENQAILSIVKGESIDSEGLSLKGIVDKAKKVLEESKLTDFQDAEKVWTSIPKPLSNAEKLIVAPDVAKRIQLEQEMAKASPAFKNYFKEKIDKVDEDINAKLSINLGLKEQAAEKTKTAEAPPKTITNESEKVRKEQEGQGEISGGKQERQDDGQKTEVQQEVLIPEYSEKLKDVSPETKVTELPDGLSVEFNGEKGTIGRSETGETLFINAEGKETIVGGGGDVSTLAEKGISRTEGTYSDKRGDYYVKDGRVFKVTKDGLKPVYEGEKANVERKEAIIRKALNPEKPKEKNVVLTDEVKDIEAPVKEEVAPTEKAVEVPKDELPFPEKEQWEIDRDAAKEHDKLFDEDEIRAAYEQRDQDISQMGRGKDFKSQVIHDNFGGLSLADWTRYGDANWLKGKEGKAFKKKYIKENDRTNLEEVADEMSANSGVEITPQDVIDYIIDRETNPKKYDGRLKQWDDAASIPKKDVSSILTGDDAMVAAIVESNRGFGMTDLEADTIKRYVESKAKNEARAKNTKSGSAEGAPKSARPIAKSERVGRKPSEKAQKKKDEAKSVKAEENKYAKAEEKITKIFDVLREKAKNNPLLKDHSPEGTKKGGGGMEDLINAAEKVIITAIRAGEKIDVAISKGIEHLREEWKRTFDSEFPEKELRDILKEGSEKEIQLAHEKTDILREELGMEPRAERDTVPIEQTVAEARRRIKKGVNVEKIADEIIRSKDPATPVEHVILSERVAQLNKELREMDPSDPLFDKKYAEAEKLIKASELSGSQAGEALGIRAHIKTVADDSLISYFQEQKRVNKDAPLTENQKAANKKEFEAITKAKEAYEKKIAKLQEDVNRLKAEKQVEKIAKKASKRTAKEKLDEDFDALAKEFSKVSRNTLSSGGPLQATGIILKMVKNRVEKGVITLSEVVDAVHEKVGEFGISKEDIIAAIAGKHGPERTRSEAAKNGYELKQEAKLVQKLMDLQNGKEPSSERGKIQKNIRLEELRKQIKEHDLTKTAEYKKRLDAQIAEVERELATGDFAKEEKAEPLKLDQETLELQDKYMQLSMEREARLLKEEYAQRSMGQKAGDIGMSLLNAPMTLMSSGDVSAVLRQGLVASTSHPILAARASKQMLKFFKSQKDFDRWHFETKNDPRYLAAKEAGLAIVDPQNPKLAAREEAFMGNIVEKIPLYGKGIKLAKIKDGKLVRTEGEYGGLVKASERAYVGFLNKMRWDVYNLLSERLKDQGITFENNPTLYKELASHVNNITGRGNIPKNMERLSPALNAAFFSPRLWASRLKLLSNFMNPLWYKKVPKEVRRFYWEDMGKFAATATIAYLMAGAGGSDVETDIRSSDFLKIRNGKKRYDILGGFQQPIRTLGQYFSGESKNIETGEIKELSDPDLPIYDRLLQKSRLEPVVQHIRGKLSPVPAAVYDMAIEGKMMDQQTPTLWKEAKRMIGPLAWQDIVSAYGEEGAKSFVTTALPTLLGVSNSIYKDPEPEPKEKPKPVKKKKKKRGVFE